MNRINFIKRIHGISKEHIEKMEQQGMYRHILSVQREYVDHVGHLLSLNERYKEALRFIADRENCYEDLPDKAAKALEE